MNDTAKDPILNKRGSNTSGLKIFLYILIAVIVAAAGTFFIVKIYIFPSEFKAVTLNAKEERILEDKLKSLNLPGNAQSSRGSTQLRGVNKSSDFDTQGNLIPEKYSEEGAKREVAFTERELNALLAKNTDLAGKLAIDLSDNLLSAKLLAPVSEDFPIMGGEVLKIRAGLEVTYERGKPIVILKGVSVMGVPFPNAWLGGLKTIDLIEEYGGDSGFWSSFAEGVEYIHVEEGRLKVKLKE